MSGPKPSAERHLAYTGTRKFSEAERFALGMIFKGANSKEIAKEMDATKPAVKGYISRINLKAGTNNRYELLAWWAQGKHYPEVQAQLTEIAREIGL